jgi:D-3-phosphoglycerate dehydrogenase
LINTSRGKIVNTPDLVDALNEKKILGAGLDVIDIESSSFNNIEKELNHYFNELINLKNVIITPHIAGWTFESNVKLSQIIIDKIKPLLK